MRSGRPTSAGPRIPRQAAGNVLRASVIDVEICDGLRIEIQIAFRLPGLSRLELTCDDEPIVYCEECWEREFGED